MLNTSFIKFKFKFSFKLQFKLHFHSNTSLKFTLYIIKTPPRSVFFSTFFKLLLLFIQISLLTLQKFTSKDICLTNVVKIYPEFFSSEILVLKQKQSEPCIIFMLTELLYLHTHLYTCILHTMSKTCNRKQTSSLKVKLTNNNVIRQPIVNFSKISETVSKSVVFNHFPTKKANFKF